MENKINKGLVVTIVILVLCLLGVSGYLVYDKIFDNKKVDVDIVKDINKDDENETKKETMSKQELEKLGKDLFEETSFRKDDIWPIFYSKDTVTYNSIDNENRLVIAWNLISDDLIDISPYLEIIKTDNRDIWKSDYPDNCMGDEGMICYSRKTSLSILKNSYQKIFGLNQSFNFVKFFSNPTEQCSLENDEVVCYMYWGGGAGFDSTYLKYVSTELVDDNQIALYTKALGHENNKIYPYGDFENEIATVSETLTEEEIFNKYGDKASNFKLTFNKDTNDNWYWVSTEFVK